jgi:hypothetical protein
MSIQYPFGSQASAAQIARELVKDLAISDIQALIADNLQEGEINRLCKAIDPAVSERVKERAEIAERIKTLSPEMAELWKEYCAAQESVWDVRKIAWFNLGFQAALKLLGGSSDFRS